MNMLSRNLPITLIVGAAGFLGSHLAEKLLEKGIQVVGVDDLSGGSLTNLAEAAKDKHFYFLNQSLSSGVNIDLPRLDYGVFCISSDVSIHEHSLNFKLFLDFVFKGDFKPKILLVSSIDLYTTGSKLNQLKEAEKLLSNLATSKKLNARVVRLAGVYGPRMTFINTDPIIPLIKETLSTQKESYLSSSDFSSRSLYIADAIDVLIKALFHGGTAHKIYDGALLHPIKLSEIKQILLDPTWHENKGFTATELPPWPTPNLIKTQKELNWKPKTKLIAGLRETIKYFKDGGEIRVQSSKFKVQSPENKLEDKSVIEPATRKEPPKLDLTPLTRPIKKHAGMVLGIALIFYGLFLPVINLVSGVVLIKSNLSGAAENLSINNLPLAQEKIDLAKVAADELVQIKDTFLVINLLRELGIDTKIWDLSLNSLIESVNGADLALNGARDLNQSLKLISGQEEGQLTQVLGASTESFSQARGVFTLLGLNLEQINSGGFLGALFNSWQTKLNYYQATAGKLQIISEILNGIASQGERRYLIVLSDNSHLKPGGGTINAGVLLKLNHGQFSSLGDINPEAQGSGSIVTPPTELKNDLNLTAWTMRESATDADFSLTGGNLISLYQNQTGVRSDGVVAIDLTGLSLLLKSIGGVTLTEGQQVTSENLLQFIKTTSNADKLETEILQAVIKKLLFVGTPNSLKLLASLDQAIIEKHLQLFFTDAPLNAKLNNLGYLNRYPQTQNKDRERVVVISMSDSNLSDIPINFNIKKTISVAVDLDRDGKEVFRISSNYTNTESSSALKFRYKIYLPSGSLLTKSAWENQDILSQVGSLSDYSQSGFSTILQILPKEQKNLKLEFINPGQATHPANGGKIRAGYKYQLKIFKQPGTLSYPINIKINYPQNWQLISGQAEYNGVFDTDKTLQLEFK